MKTLVIAEKPSVAGDLARALGKAKKVGDNYEVDNYIISFAVGHIVELYMPEDFDKKWKRWALETLPIIPKKFQLKPIDSSKDRFKDLKRLLASKEVDAVINACDAGREGELIFTYLYELTGCKKPVSRLWLASMTPAAIREAFSSLRSGDSMKPLQDAARCRSESDWLIGINGTRAVTLRMFGRGGKQIATVGRVQTPTLSMVVEREKAIRAFEPRAYWKVVGKFGITAGDYEGIYQKPGFRKGDDEHDRVDRLWDRAEAEQLLAAMQQVERADLSEKKKRTTQIAPRLYDLTTLQREANGRFGFAAGKTLRVAQALYEKHKMLTYPRTDSRALPEDYPEKCRETLAALPEPFAVHAEKVLAERWINPGNKRIFNNKQVSDHFAIIPTTVVGKRLNSDEEKIYDMVVRRFIAVFFPSAEYDVTTRISAVGDHQFKTEGKVLAKPGWLSVYGRENSAPDTLPAIGDGDGTPPTAAVREVRLDEDQTRPPPRYTEATLLAAMEGAGKLLDDEELAEAMKEKGLGTPATRASIIDHLAREKYIEREQRELVPTAKAENLVTFLEEVKIDELTSPALTGEWEHRLHQIEHHSLSRDEFMAKIAEMTTRIVERTRTFEPTLTRSSIPSPIDGQPLWESFRQWESEQKVKAGNREIPQVVIYKVIGNRRMNEEEARELIEKRQLGPLDGFRSKAGKPYSALLRLEEKENTTFRVAFDFGGNDRNGDGDIDLSEFPVIATCPKDGAPIHEAPTAYICANYGRDEESCDFRVSRSLLGKTLEREQFIKLIENKKTDLIEGFRSNRTKRLFSAHLILKDDASIGFEFPPRAAKKKTAKKG